jgi:hypothetical protein
MFSPRGTHYEKAGDLPLFDGGKSRKERREKKEEKREKERTTQGCWQQFEKLRSLGPSSIFVFLNDESEGDAV